MADEGYWRARARRAPKPALAWGLVALVGAATLGLGVLAAEWAPRLFDGFSKPISGGGDVLGVIGMAIFLGLMASIAGGLILAGMSRALGKRAVTAAAFLLLAPAGVAGALTCAFLMPGPLDDRLTDARVTDSWGHYVDTVRFDETHLEQQLAQLELWNVFEPYKLSAPNHWAAARLQVKLGRELIAKYRGYEIYRRDEALKTIEEGNLRPAARAKARQRILDGYAVLGPLFASRWDIIDAQMVQIEKGSDLLQSSPGGWRATPGGFEFTNHAQYVGLNRIIARSRDLEDQEKSVVCKLNKELGLRKADCDASALIEPAQRVR
jgi:hypothetical protein